MLKLHNIKLQLGSKSIFEDLSLEFAEGKINVLLGPSGCGKSTVLRLLAQFLIPDSGLMENSHQSVGFVFQEPRLLPWLSLIENIQLPLKIGSAQGSLPEGDAKFWIQHMGLEGNENKFPHELSGGMKMRASIARALRTKPSLLLMDEPFAALDEQRRETLQDLLLKLQDELGLTLVFVTHSIQEALTLADRVFVFAPTRGQILRKEDFVVSLPEKQKRDLQFLNRVQSFSAAYRDLKQAP
jgi:NitT/TauT family transport system ATP-binding protein